jgi:hypothetical protein
VFSPRRARLAGVEGRSPWPSWGDSDASRSALDPARCSRVIVEAEPSTTCAPLRRASVLACVSPRPSRRPLKQLHQEPMFRVSQQQRPRQQQRRRASRESAREACTAACSGRGLQHAGAQVARPQISCRVIASVHGRMPGSAGIRSQSRGTGCTSSGAALEPGARTQQLRQRCNRQGALAVGQPVR